MPVVIEFGLYSPAVTKGRSKKLHHPWQGPLTVTKVFGDVFRIKKDTPPRKKPYKPLHYNRLKPYKLSTNCQPDPWDLVGDPMHTSDNEQGRPLTSCQVSEQDQDHSEQPAT